MNPKHEKRAATLLGALCTALSFYPMTGLGGPEQSGITAAIPVQMNMTAFLMIAILLLITTLMFFAFRARFVSTNIQLQDITNELTHTRDNLTQSNRQLEKVKGQLETTTNHYQSTLFDAQVGIFQMDLNGKCTYINKSMQELSGLYPKKALKEGIESALHPDDRQAYQEAWAAFTDDNKPFEVRCRFKLSKGRETHVVCSASKVLDERKYAESYIGWVSNATPFHEEQLQLEACTTRYAQFIDETVEGYFQLTPENPIPITDSADKMAKAIMEGMTLTGCNETFAAMYGSNPRKLSGKSIGALANGCGPLKNLETIKSFVASEYKSIGLESVRQDPRGNRLSLFNNVIGLIEDNKLVGIWGSQRNVSQQKREKAELESQAQFMKRILNALPADVHVKDTRCRYLYASQKLADRTGIGQEEWLGKTIFEVMPATPRDHDKSAIEVMKNNKVARSERKYEARGKTGWMETVQLPLVSDEGLVEGVVGLALDISERKQKEDKIRKNLQQLDQQLKTRTTELQNSQDEHGKTAISLRDASQKLRIRDAELENHANEFKEKLAERKREEELLRQNEKTLLTRQKQLEKQLVDRLALLDKETDKRKKWEELLAIKEDELRKLDTHATLRQKQLEEEIALREQTEVNLTTSQTGLEKYRKELETLTKERDQETHSLTEKHQKEFHSEQTIRQQAEKQLKKTDTLLQSTQIRLKELTEQHAAELEHEVSERKAATTKLIASTEELDELKQQFSQRIEQETKTLKQELAQKQIREKSLRQHEKDLDSRIKELEKSLQLKVKEQEEQIQAREGAEVERKQMEGKLEQLNHRQKSLIERETQKMNLIIAEIRLEEVKLRKQVGELEQAKEGLENTVNTRIAELKKADQEKQKLATSLAHTQEKLDQLVKDQSALVSKETATLRDEVNQVKLTETALRKQEEQLQAESTQLEETIKQLNGKLEAETKQREETGKKLKELQLAFDASQDNASALIKRQTRDLENKIMQHERNEADMQKNESALQQQAEDLRKTIDTRTGELTEARTERKKAEEELAQVIERSSQSAKQIESSIDEIKKEHQDELARIHDEHGELRRNEIHYRSLFTSSTSAFLQIDPKTGKVQSANPAAARLFGEDASKELSGKTFADLSPTQQPDNTPSADMAKARLHSVLESAHESFEWLFHKSDKAVFYGMVNLSSIEIEKQSLILAVVQDISALKNTQKELQQTIDEAHTANRINSNLVDEINEAVQSSLEPVVQSSSTFVAAENLRSDQKESLSKMNLNCRALIDMMNYRRELSHMADGSDEVEVGKCDLHELIKDLDTQYCQRAETKKLFFAVSYAQYQSANNVPRLIETDEAKLRKVLGILLGYALAHTDRGRIGLHATRKSSEGDSITTSFEFAYTGVAKQDERLSRIFGDGDPEQDDATDMKFGLTLARRYVRMLGGTVSLEYRQGDVTALCIDFPFKKVESEIVMPKQDDEEAAGAA